MIPIGDDNSDRHRFPIINYALILANIIVFIYYQRMGVNTDFTMGYAAVPAEILSGKDLVTNAQQYTDAVTGQVFTLPGLAPGPYPIWITLITSMFMHGGWAHLGGNLLYLAVFGDNIENRLGHGRYLIFYLLTGIIATFAQILSTVVMGQDLLVPSLGASGAISAVLGAYLRLYPTRQVTILAFIIFMRVPALIVLGLWIVFQIISSLGAFGGLETGSIAYAAHIGGFIAGFLLIKKFSPPQTKRVVSTRSRY